MSIFDNPPGRLQPTIHIPDEVQPRPNDRTNASNQQCCFSQRRHLLHRKVYPTKYFFHSFIQKKRCY